MVGAAKSSKSKNPLTGTETKTRSTIAPKAIAAQGSKSKNPLTGTETAGLQRRRSEWSVGCSKSKNPLTGTETPGRRGNLPSTSRM